MATTVNIRDAFLASETQRLSVVPENFITLTSPSTQFKVDTSGVPDVTSILITANLVGRLYGTCTFSVQSGSASIVDNGNNTVTITFSGMLSNYITIRASLSCLGATYTRDIVIYKVYDGNVGAPGDPGTPGAAGSRGSVTSYITGTLWSDSSAQSAIYSQTSTAYLVPGDTVTISNGTSFAETKYWNGTTWQSPGTVIDGGLLVNGTLTADKIGTGTISSNITMGGTFIVNSTGSIYSAGKTSYASNTAGFWLGYDSTTYKFNIGNATSYLKWSGSSLTFTGTLSGASGSFSGSLDSSGYVYADGGIAKVINSTTYTGALIGNSINTAGYDGVIGWGGSNASGVTGGSAANTGVYGFSLTTGSGVFGSGATVLGGNGVYGLAGVNAGVGVLASNISSTGIALECTKKFKWGAYTWSAPAGSGLFLKDDGTWAAASGTGATPTTFTWTAGSTSGPTGSLSGTNMTAVSFAAIPTASATASGIVTTGSQSFAGTKTFASIIGTNGFNYTSTSSTYLTAGTEIRLDISGTSVLATNSSNTVVLGNIWASVDNAKTCGTSTKRWTTVYATTGTINTSDARLKTEIKSTDLGLDFILKLNPVKYKWISGGKVDTGEFTESTISINDYGDTKSIKVPIYKDVPGKRVHYGLLAQEVKSILDTLNIEDFAGWVLSDVSDPDSTQSLRYDQFISPIIKAIQELSDRLTYIERNLSETT